MIIELIGIAIGVIVVLVVFALIWNSFWLWWQSILSNAPVSLVQIIFMRFRKVNPSTIVTARITARKAGIDIIADELEAHYLAGGNVVRVVQALISANKANIVLSYDRCCAIDLAGRDVKEAVDTSVNPKVIDVPSGTMARTTIDAIAGDGIQLKVKARVTVRTNLERLVGGATEETVVARVGEGIVTTIGSAENHMRVLENPDRISKVVLERGLDSGTAFEIPLHRHRRRGTSATTWGRGSRSIRPRPRSRWPRRRPSASARSRWPASRRWSPSSRRTRPRWCSPRRRVPKAIADAFRSGNLGIMDYYGMQNIQADTRMRSSLAAGEEDGTPAGAPPPGGGSR